MATYSIEGLREKDWPTKCIDGLWVLARPLSYPTLKERFAVAWLAFTGKADLVVWDKQ